MESNKVKFTDAALEQLERFKQEQAKKLEESIVENKKFPGSDFIEITASDIQDEARKFSLSKPKSNSDLKYLLVYFYFFTGISLILLGFFYQDIIHIWNSEPKQLLYIATGFVITIMSGVLSFYIKYSEKSKNSDTIRRSELIRIEKLYLDEMMKTFYEEQRKYTQDTDKIKSVTG